MKNKSIIGFRDAEGHFWTEVVYLSGDIKSLRCSLCNCHDTYLLDMGKEDIACKKLRVPESKEKTIFTDEVPEYDDFYDEE